MPDKRDKKCCEPFKDKHKKPKRQFGLQAISENDRQIYAEMYPNFDWDSAKYLCLRCRTKLFTVQEQRAIIKTGIQLFANAKRRKSDKEALEKIAGQSASARSGTSASAASTSAATNARVSVAQKKTSKNISPDPEEPTGTSSSKPGFIY